MKIFYFVTLWLLVVTGTTRAQLIADKKPGTPNSFNEYSVYATSGMSNLIYKTDDGKTGYGFGYGAGLSYTCNVISNFGISMGAEYTNFAGSLTRGSLSETYDAVDETGTHFDYTYSMEQYEERQSMAVLSMPLMLRAKIPTGWYRRQIYVAGGVKLALPLASKVNISAKNIRSTGYYPYENVLYENMPQHGFYDGLNVHNEQSRIKGFTTMTILSFEAGLCFGAERNVLYVGAYFDYMPKAAGQTSSKHPMNYSGSLSYESILNSAMISDMKMMSVGVKLKFSLF